MATSVARQRERLLARLAEIDTERGHINYTLSVLDYIEDSEDSDTLSSNELTPPPITSPTRHVVVEAPNPEDDPAEIEQAQDRIRAYFKRGETAAFAVRAVFSHANPRRAERIVEEMRDLGWASEAKNEVESVRAALSRLVADKVIDRASYGQYAPAFGLKTYVDAQIQKHPLPGFTPTGATPEPNPFTLPDSELESGTATDTSGVHTS